MFWTTADGFHEGPVKMPQEASLKTLPYLSSQTATPTPASDRLRHCMTRNEANAASCTIPFVGPQDSEAERSTSALLQSTGCATLFESLAACGKMGETWRLRTSPRASILHPTAVPKLDQLSWAQAASESHSREVCREQHISDVQ